MKKKVGIIGYGWVAGANHRTSYKQTKDVEIVAVCDVRQEMLERAKEHFGLTDERLFTDYKAMIDSGAVGKVYHCYIKCIKESGLWEGRRLEWRFQKEYGGTGVLCDLGSHMIDFLNWMNEDIVGLSANMGIFVKKRQKLDSDEWADVTTDDYANIIADLKSGATANIDLSRCAKTEGQLVEFIVYGEKGYIRYCNYVGEGLEICYGDKETIAKGKQRVATPEKYGDYEHIYQSQSFVDYANGKKDNFTSTIDDGLRAQMVIDAAIKSAQEKRYVTIEEIRKGL